MAERLFAKGVFVGTGLIGGSLALAAKQAGLIGTTVGYGRNEITLARARALGLIDDYRTDPAAALAGADFLFFATPVESVVPLALGLAPHMAPGLIVSDGGSVKGAIVRGLEGKLPAGIRFVGGHPIAGSEKSGPDAADPGLYRDHYAILTPTPTTDADALDKVVRLWEGVGAKTLTMDIDDHDAALAIISHLPHLVAYALVNTLKDEDPDRIVGKFVAGGFKGATRIAASHPEMWRDIFAMNRTATLAAVARFKDHLDRFAAAIEEERFDDLLTMLEQVRALKLALDAQR
jgi:prephenate dehydrogenase